MVVLVTGGTTRQVSAVLIDENDNGFRAAPSILPGINPATGEFHSLLPRRSRASDLA
jgi:hypothetical protein